MSSTIVISETRSVIQVSEPANVTILETPVTLTIDEVNSSVNISVDSVLNIVEQSSSVTVNQSNIEIVEVGVMGPQGPAGEDATLSDEAVRVDDVGGTVLYKGWAVIGTENSDALWKIARYTFTGDDLVIEWADGNNNYDNVWDNRLALSYD